MPNNTTSDRNLLLEITIVLIIKVALLFVIWHSFFSADPDLDNTDAVAESFLGTSEQGETH